MAEKAEKETANWTKGATGLTITKNALTPAIIEILRKWITDFDAEIFNHLHEFLENILKLKETPPKVDVKYIGSKGRSNNWKITGECPCGMRLCQKILNELCDKQVSNTINVVWRPTVKESKLNTLNASKTSKKYTTFFAERCYICRELNCPFERNRKGVPLFDDELSDKIFNIYWPLANMYMFRGKDENKFPNTGPESTDTTLMFKLMKNCKLFNIDDKDVEHDIYDGLLEVRNFLMHSADNRLSDDALDECFDRMVNILNVKKFANDYSEKAIKELEKLKDMRMIMTTLTSDEVSIVKQAFDLQESALEFEMNVTGMLKNDDFLAGILKESKARREKYIGNSETRDAEKKSQTQRDAEPKSQTQKDTEPKSRTQGGAATAAGATTGAVLGAIGGPPGAILGATIGGMFGKLFE